MKKLKIVSAVCAMALTSALCFTGCGTGDAGHYDFYSMTDDGETFTQEDMEKVYKEIGEKAPEMYLELEKDGSGKLVLGDDDTEDIEWEDGVITVDGEEIEYTIEDGKLSMEKDGSKMVFEKAE
ncbi:MAG: hypothetical protein ACI4JA_10230 [Oscillospiraceae bacterium]